MLRMSEKTIFGEQDDIPKDGDDGAAEEAATLMEETKSAPRRKSTRKSKVENDPSTEIGDTEESEGAYRGNPSLRSDRSHTGEPRDTETIEDHNLMLKDLHIEGRSKLTSIGKGPDSKRGFVRRDRE